MFGFLNVRKPAGPTSHDIVAQVRRRLARTIKVGHAGTLDPFAEGVLVLCVGQATRLVEYLHEQPKRYRAMVRLGAVSSTDDPQGEITPTPGAAAPAESAVKAAMERLAGQIQQVPPAHSAVHVEGCRAYALARRGQVVELSPRAVTIHSLELLRYDWPTLQIDVRCGTGTYIRSLARDIGAALGVGGYCEALTRTAVGPFELAEAHPAEQLDLPRDLVDPLVVVSHLSSLRLDQRQLKDICLGRAIGLPQPAPAAPGQQLVLLDPAGRLAAIAQAMPQDQARPVKVFASR